jgi:O-antigen/teichoic acid export membrane protein
VELATATELKTRAFKGGAKLLIRQVSTKIVGLVANVLLARLLMPEQYGIYAVVTSATALFGLMGDVGLGASLVRQPTEPTPEDEATVFTAQQICIAVPAILLIVLAPQLVQFYKFSSETVWLIRFVAISGIIGCFGSISRIRLERGMVFGPLAMIDAVRSILFQIVAVGCAFAGAGVWSFAIASVASELSAVILSEKYSPWKMTWRLDWERLKGRVSFGFSYQALNLFNFLKDCLNPFFIGAIYGANVVGVIGFAITAANYPMLFAGVFYRLYFPAFSRCQHDPVALKELIETVLWWNNLLMIGITTVAFPLIGVLVPTVFGQKWIEAIPLVYLLLFANLTMGTTIVLVALANAIGKPGITLRYTALSAITNWILTVPLVLKFGIVGFGFAQVTLSLANFLFYQKMKRVVEFDLYGPMRPFLWAFLVSSSLIAAILRITHAGGWLAIGMFGILGAVNFMTVSNLLSGGKMRARITEMVSLYRV